ncbi:DUF356 domain-containing protein [Methanosphaera sp. WGK6]|uniref:DUF356 domain-containing protein n=1 Tax=Methanosphaera sp. WGK6 TaxID=1561964 RepID=UPI00084C3443|nr:DUF356 domain-containing protein [Methanosphaera sp. WGK6]OED30715.1 hypothetical protein NL43_01910 [Methanosphaera sp. WGK6]
MALILIRAMNKKKALNGLADLERHAKLTIMGKPKLISLDKVHNVTKRVIKQEPRNDIKLAILIKVQEDTTVSIMNLRKIHPPVHVIVISEEYPEFTELNKEFNKAKIFDGYYSFKKRSLKNSTNSNKK